MYTAEVLKNDSEWESFVSLRPDISQYFSLSWREIIQKSFGHLPVYLLAKENNNVDGILPLFLMKSYIFGNILVSLPFLNYGGLCVNNGYAAQALTSKAIEIARHNNVKYLELRNDKEFNLELPVKKNKVSMILTLSDDPQFHWDSYKTKVRNHIRKAEKNGLKVKTGGKELLQDFYEVFSLNMRDLGTPVYSINFFKTILDILPNTTKIFSVYYSNKVLASGFTIASGATLEIPWASSKRKYNSLSANPLMYWEIIKYACKAGFKYFDFGRCSWDSNTFTFKKEWGSKPQQLYWNYWVKNNGNLPELNPTNPKYKLLINI